jgi:hypothetical protein
MVLRAVSTTITVVLLVIVALVGAFRILFAVVGTAVSFAFKREIATRRFRRRLARCGIEEAERDEFTRQFRTMVPFLGMLRIRR